MNCGGGGGGPNKEFYQTNDCPYEGEDRYWILNCQVRRNWDISKNYKHRFHKTKQ